MAAFAVDLAPLLDDVSLNLYAATTSLIPNGNFMISPVSILYATVLVYLGAKGDTKSNIHSSLNFNKAFPSTNTDVSSAFGQLMSLYEASPVTNDKKLHPGEPFQLKIANGIFLQDGLKISQKYMDQAMNNLKAGAKRENFTTDAATATKHINTWVAEHTGRKIMDLIPSGALNQDTKAVVANAVYFKASWLDPFDAHFTKLKPFHFLNGTAKNVSMMYHDKKKYNYTEDATLGIQYLEIPYDDHQASMLVILPKEKTGVRNLEKALTAEKLQHLAKAADKTMVNIRLPKFNIEGTFDLKKMLKRTGVNVIFDRDAADFGDMIPAGKVFVSDAFHKTFIAVDENGTEAGAASAHSFSSRMHQRTTVFHADHPFMFAIRHDPSKTILFVGRLEEP